MTHEHPDMRLSRLKATGKVEAVSTETRCVRCEIVQRELELERSAKQMAESRSRLLDIDLKLAHARVAQLEAEVAASWAKRGII